MPVLISSSSSRLAVKDEEAVVVANCTRAIASISEHPDARKASDGLLIKEQTLATLRQLASGKSVYGDDALVKSSAEVAVERLSWRA